MSVNAKKAAANGATVALGVTHNTPKLWQVMNSVILSSVLWVCFQFDVEEVSPFILFLIPASC